MHKNSTETITPGRSPARNSPTFREDEPKPDTDAARNEKLRGIMPKTASNSQHNEIFREIELKAACSISIRYIKVEDSLKTCHPAAQKGLAEHLTGWPVEECRGEVLEG